MKIEVCSSRMLSWPVFVAFKFKWGKLSSLFTVFTLNLFLATGLIPHSLSVSSDRTLLKTICQVLLEEETFSACFVSFVFFRKKGDQEVFG